MKKQKIKYRELWKKYKDAKTKDLKEKYRNDLAEKYLYLVKGISFKLASKLNWKVNEEELFSYGIDGLFIAISKFNYNKGVKFEQYSSIRIHGSMIDGLRKEDIIPRSVRINFNKFEKEKEKLESQKGRFISNVEVADELELKDYSKNVKKYHPIMYSSLDGSDNFSNEEDNFMFKKDSNLGLIDTKNESPIDEIQNKEFFSKLLGKDFSNIERRIIFLYYYKNCTMEMISKNINMSESRISQIHNDVLNRLKDKIKRNPNYFSEYQRLFTGSSKKRKKPSSALLLK